MAKSNGECELCGQESSLRSFGDKNLCMKCGIIHITAGSNPQLLIQCLVEAGKIPVSGDDFSAEVEFLRNKISILSSDNNEKENVLTNISNMLEAKDNESTSEAAIRIMHVLEELKEDNSAYQEGISSLRNDLDEINAIIGTESGVSTAYKLREVLSELSQVSIGLPKLDLSRDTILLDIVLASMAGEDIQLGPDVIRQLR